MHDIKNHWKGNFLVADLYEDGKCIGVCGTVSYKETAFAAGKQLDNTFELFSLSTDIRFVWLFNYNNILLGLDREG